MRNKSAKEWVLTRISNSRHMKRSRQREVQELILGQQQVQKQLHCPMQLQKARRRKLMTMQTRRLLHLERQRAKELRTRKPIKRVRDWIMQQC